MLSSCKKYFSHFIILSVNSEMHQEQTVISARRAIIFPSPSPIPTLLLLNTTPKSKLCWLAGPTLTHPTLFGKITPVPGRGRHLHFTLKHMRAKGENRRKARCEQQHKLAVKYFYINFKILGPETAFKMHMMTTGLAIQQQQYQHSFLKCMWCQGRH